MDQFPYGKIIGTDCWSLGSSIMCVDKDELQRFEHGADLPAPKVGRAYNVLLDRPPNCAGLVSLVVNRRHDVGWHARLVDGVMGTGKLHYLCYALTTHPVVFPSAAEAKIAAKIFSSGQHWEVATLVWVNEAGDYWFAEKEQRSIH
jgi:hypothetical protein